MYAERAILPGSSEEAKTSRAASAARAEVDPPQRHAADEGHHERRDHCRGRFNLAKGRAGHQDRLAQGDDDEQLASVGGESALAGPYFGSGPAETRRVLDLRLG